MLFKEMAVLRLLYTGITLDWLEWRVGHNSVAVCWGSKNKGGRVSRGQNYLLALGEELRQELEFFNC